MSIIFRTYISIKTAQIITPNAILTIIRGPPNQITHLPRYAIFRNESGHRDGRFEFSIRIATDLEVDLS